MMENDLDALRRFLEPRHLDADGSPLCTAPAQGALVVDEPVDVTCAACLLALSERLMAVRG